MRLRQNIFIIFSLLHLRETWSSSNIDNCNAGKPDQYDNKDLLQQIERLGFQSHFRFKVVKVLFEMKVVRF